MICDIVVIFTILVYKSQRPLSINGLHYTGNTCELISASCSSVVLPFLSSCFTKSWFYYLISSSGQGPRTQVLSKLAEKNICPLSQSSLPSAGGMDKQLMANSMFTKWWAIIINKPIGTVKGFLYFVVTYKYSRNTCWEHISANFSPLHVGSVPSLFMLNALPQ